MIRRVILAVLMAGLALSAPTGAQITSTLAFCYLDPGILGGALQATDTGWHWSLVCGFRSPTTRVVISGIGADTLETDTLAQVGVKLANAVKADMIARGFAAPTMVFLPQTVSVAPQ